MQVSAQGLLEVPSAVMTWLSGKAEFDMCAARAASKRLANQSYPVNKVGPQALPRRSQTRLMHCAASWLWCVAEGTAKQALA
jgi:hypothetical protein